MQRLVEKPRHVQRVDRNGSGEATRTIPWPHSTRPSGDRPFPNAGTSYPRCSYIPSAIPRGVRRLGNATHDGPPADRPQSGPPTTRWLCAVLRRGSALRTEFDLAPREIDPWWLGTRSGQVPVKFPGPRPTPPFGCFKRTAYDIDRALQELQPSNGPTPVPHGSCRDRAYVWRSGPEGGVSLP